MNRHIHHPSCPARQAPASRPLSRVDELWAGERCICPKPVRRRPQLVEAVCFAAMLGLIAGLPIYLLWRYTA